jgi:hypothetical protein
MKTILAFLLGLALWSAIPSAQAIEALATPGGRVVLTISGKVAKPNDGKDAAFDMAMLEGMEQHVVVTRTPWTGAEPVTFKGPLVRDVLAAAGASGTEATAVALNDYKSVLPMADFSALDVIVALSLGGKPMSVRDKGPLWIIYPLSAKPEIDNLATHAKMAWQLKEIQVK